jgi:RecA-family ATPase
MTVVNCKNAKKQYIKRYDTGINELNWQYGTTIIEEENRYYVGMPYGKISLFAGERGVGKTRFAAEVCKSFLNKNKRGKVLYFQNEVNPSEFLMNVNIVEDNFFVSNSDTIKNQIEDIREKVPNLIVIDSINMLEGYNSGSDSTVKEVIKKYKKICERTHCHIMILCQLTKDGTARGSSTLPHLVDIEFAVYRFNKENLDCFTVRSTKNRSAAAGRKSGWNHLDEGVECFSESRQDDLKWCNLMKETYMPLIREQQKIREKLVREAKDRIEADRKAEEKRREINRKVAAQQAKERAEKLRKEKEAAEKDEWEFKKFVELERVKTAGRKVGEEEGKKQAKKAARQSQRQMNRYMYDLGRLKGFGAFD